MHQQGTTLYLTRSGNQRTQRETSDRPVLPEPMALEQHVPSQSSLASRVLRANAALRTPQRSQPMTAALSIKPWPRLCPNQGWSGLAEEPWSPRAGNKPHPRCCGLRADVHVPESKETNCGEGIVYVRFVRLRRCERGVAPARRLGLLSRMQGLCLVGVWSESFLSSPRQLEMRRK
jgi:hypothetical protein